MQYLGFAARGKVSGIVERSYPPGEVSRMHARTPPGAKCPVFTLGCYGRTDRRYPSGTLLGTHARRPPGAKRPVFMRVVIAAWGYVFGILAVFGMLALRFTAVEVSGGRVPNDILSDDQYPRR